jgi:hypothetical protein
MKKLISTPRNGRSHAGCARAGQMSALGLSFGYKRFAP